MKIHSLQPRRVPIAVGLLALVLWTALGIRRTEREGTVAVLDSPVHVLGPRVVPAGWHFAPPGLLRLTIYPVAPATYTLEAGGDEAALVSREGTAFLATATLRYRVEAERVLDVHQALGPQYERDAVGRWALEGLQIAARTSSYSEISGARTEALRQALAGSLGERLRQSGLVLLSCDVSGVRIRPTPGRPASEPTTASGTRVLFIGLDGADWNVLDPLLRSGRMPNLERLIRAGTRGRLRTITPMLSPVVWTSIATGVLPARHGIIDFLVATDREGEKIPVTSGFRKVRAIWNILGDRGLTVGVVGWWATYPAERVNGFIVSDRVAYQLFGAQPGREQVREGKVFPPDIDALVGSLVIAPETLGADRVGRYIRFNADPEDLPDEQKKLIEDFKTLLAAGDSYARIALELMRRQRPDFMALYLEGTDTVGHLFMPFMPPVQTGVDAAAVLRFGRTVDEYYRHVDSVIGDLVTAAAPGTAVVVCSDHGFRTGENRPMTDSRIGHGQAADWHRKYGIVVLSGGPFRKGGEMEEASVLDITPTILALFGLPIAEDMDGRPIVEAFDPEFIAAHPISYVPTYEGQAIVSATAGTPLPVPSDPAGDEGLKEKLRSLGYLTQDTANSHNNRGLLLLAQGKLDEAIEEFRLAVDGAEDMSVASLNMARAYFNKKDYASATEAIQAHLRRKPRSKEAENLLGNIAMEQGRPGEAEARFRAALGYEPNYTDALNSLGILYDRQGRDDDAIRQFERVVSVDPDYAEAYNNIGVIEKNRGRVDEAIKAFRRAVAADPEFAGSYSNLALVLQDRGDLEAAEEQFLLALKREPGNAAVRTNFGALLYTQGRLEEAKTELEKAVAADRTYASAYNNLGAVYGRLGRPEEEITAYRKAIVLDPRYADVHHNLGLALLKQRQTMEGERELRRALDIDPRYAPAYLNLARSLLGRGVAREAADVLGRASQTLPRDPEIAGLLGEAYLRLGDIAPAIAAFERSLALRPEQPDLKRRLETLRNAPASRGGDGRGQVSPAETSPPQQPQP